jgi:hypothetical protein
VTTVERDVAAARDHYLRLVAALTRVWQSGLTGTASLVDLLIDEFTTGLDVRFLQRRTPWTVPRPVLPEDVSEADDEVYDHVWAHLFADHLTTFNYGYHEEDQ